MLRESLLPSAVRGSVLRESLFPSSVRGFVLRMFLRPQENRGEKKNKIKRRAS